ncbi:MAG: peptide ABC transporter substrate-binding protein, partial [Gammaproteobacteria bacterium]|nr:peptide ABC transporter substrate-binding protein [Gammaproteobacteria bacterium]
YLHQIKRLAHPQLHSPIAELMKTYIVGFRELGERLKADGGDSPSGVLLDLRDYALEGVEVVDDHRYRVRLYGKYPQFRFWLAMPFFAPMPWEAERFYSQPGLVAKNITLDWYPVGTGAYQLTENNPNRRIVLSRNPYFHEEFYPASGESGDRAAGVLADAGRRLPFVDRVVLTLEKETIPYWNKFLQGYFDASGLASDNFDQAVQFSGQGNAELTPAMQAQGISLETSVAASSFYMGFNMLDPVVGGLDERHCKLRQALNIALDYEEFITIFMNGRGIPAQGMLPPGIFGHQAGPGGINPYVYDWAGDAPRRKPIEAARQRLAEAGYPRGIDADTGKPLVLYLDITARGPDDKSLLNWYRKQFDRLGIQLVLRATDYNQFQQKMANGNAQIFQWGWNADYPDPENFFFLLYGPNRKAAAGGENAANYQSERFDRLFERMRTMDDGPERLALIQQLQDIVRHDAPWIFGYHPKSFSLHHAWYRNLKPNLMANNELKYQAIVPEQRVARQREWNRPRVWPLGIAGVLFLAALAPAWIAYRRRLRAAAL